MEVVRFRRKLQRVLLTLLKKELILEKIRMRSKSIFDHLSQPDVFNKSISTNEKKHIKHAFAFELRKVEIVPIRQRMLKIKLEINELLSKTGSEKLGLVPERLPQPIRQLFLQIVIMTIIILLKFNFRLTMHRP